MSICDAIENWDDLTPEERYEQMKEWAEEYSREWGMDPPNFSNTDAPWGAAGGGPAAYDATSNTVYLGPSLFSDDGGFSAEDVVGEAANELRHAMQWNYYGEWTNFDMPKPAREADADAFGDAVRDFAEDECDPGDDSAPEDSDGDDDDWELVEEDGGGDDGLERPGDSKPKDDEDAADEEDEEDPIG